VSHEALRDHASRVRFAGTDVDVFEAYRDLIERVASNAYDAGERFDDQGRVLVTSEALGRAWAWGTRCGQSSVADHPWAGAAANALAFSSEV
jgi:hypothetical protein